MPSYKKPFYLLSPEPSNKVIKVTNLKKFLTQQANLRDADYFAICALKDLDSPKKSHKGWRLCDKDGNLLKLPKANLEPFYLLSPDSKVVKVTNVAQFIKDYNIKGNGVAQAIYLLRKPDTNKYHVKRWQLCDKKGNILKVQPKRIKGKRMQGSQKEHTNTKMSPELKEKQVIDPNGVKHSFYNMLAFTEKHGLNYQCFCKFLNGKLPTYKGWQRVEQVETY